MSNRNLELWQTRINDYRASDKSARQWCKENSISFSSLKYWITKLNKEQANSYSSTEFVPISTEGTRSKSTSSPVTIRFGRISIDISEGCQPDTIRILFEALNPYV